MCRLAEIYYDTQHKCLPHYNRVSTEMMVATGLFLILLLSNVSLQNSLIFKFKWSVELTVHLATEILESSSLVLERLG